MRRCTVLECVDNEAELVFCILRADSKHFEHPLLHLCIVDTDTSATKLGTIEHEVVSIGANALQVFFLVAAEPFFMLRLRCGERMVHSIEALGFVIPLKKREVNDPKRSEDLGITQAKTVTHLYTKYAKHGLDLAFVVTAHYKNEVSGLCLYGLGQFGKVFRSIELVNRRLECAVCINLYVDKTFGAYLRAFYPFCKLVQLLAGVL